jgi:hypothetical protein
LLGKENRTMRKFLLLLLLAASVLTAQAAEKVSVEQLDQALAAAKGTQDSDLAKQLAGLELTERVSSARLSQWEAGLPGSQSRQALVAVADAAAFKQPPSAEILSTPAPDLDAQRRIMSLAADYVGKTIPKLPNFFATRDTVRYQDRPAGFDADGIYEAGAEPLHAVLGNSSVTVLYRNGQEVVDAGDETKARKPYRKQNQMDRGLSAWGIFGPILGTVLVDAAQSDLSWSRWEQGAAGPAAVFRYAVPKEKSNYEVKWCCFQTGKEPQLFQHIFGYHGEMTIDPSTGTILRLTLMADFNKSPMMDLGLELPIWEADIMVEYAPVEIGGKTYICPAKSVSVSNALTVAYKQGGALVAPVGSLKKMLNDVTFKDYHLFRAEARVLAADSAEPENR